MSGSSDTHPAVRGPRQRQDQKWLSRDRRPWRAEGRGCSSKRERGGPSDSSELAGQRGVRATEARGAGGRGEAQSWSVVGDNAGRGSNAGQRRVRRPARCGRRGPVREWTTEERPQKGRSVRPASAPEGHDSDGVDASGEPMKSCTGGFIFIAEEAIVLEFCGVGRL